MPRAFAGEELADGELGAAVRLGDRRAVGLELDRKPGLVQGHDHAASDLCRAAGDFEQVRELAHQRAASPLRYCAVRTSRLFLSSGSMGVSAALRVSSSCSGRLAPMIGAVMTGLASTQATAI